MKKLILLLLFIPLVFSCNKNNDDDVPPETNTYTLTIKNTDGHLTYSKVELAGHNFTMTSQEQTFIIDGDVVREVTNQLQLVSTGVKLFYECLPCSDVRGCNYDEDVSIEFIKETPAIKVQIDPRTDGFHQFNHCAHKHEVTYN